MEVQCLTLIDLGLMMMCRMILRGLGVGAAKWRWQVRQEDLQKNSELIV